MIKMFVTCFDQSSPVDQFNTPEARPMTFNNLDDANEWMHNGNTHSNYHCTLHLETAEELQEIEIDEETEDFIRITVAANIKELPDYAPCSIELPEASPQFSDLSLEAWRLLGER